MRNRRIVGTPASNGEAAYRDHAIQMLAMEYEALRAEILTRTTARFQFLGFVTAAAALLGSGITSPFLSTRTWILAITAALIVVFGMLSFFRMGHSIVLISARVAHIEQRLNELVPAGPGSPNLLSWESEHQHLSRWAKLRYGVRFSQTPSPRVL
jgi:hypothetical protein